MSTGQSQQFCVRWNSHLGSLGAAFPQLLAGQRFVDVTLACEGHQVHCHRLVLAACSTYFENLLGENPCQHPIIILPRDIKLWAIQALVDFMYKGEVNVSQAGLPDLMKCAEILKIRGLCGSDALNLNQIHSPTESYQQQQHGTGSDSGNTNASTKPTDGSSPSAKQAGGQFQPQFDQHSRSQHNSSSNQSGPKGQLLSSLHLQPVVMRGHHHQQQAQDEGNNSDNGGDSGNEICIKTEDLMIDEDTNSKQCDEDDEREDNDTSDKMPAEFALANVTCEYELNNQQTTQDSGTVSRRVRRSEELLQQAAEYVSRGETFQNVSLRFDIPISTIRFFMARKGILPRRKRGRTAAMLPYNVSNSRLPVEQPNPPTAFQTGTFNQQQYQQQLNENMAMASIATPTSEGIQQQRAHPPNDGSRSPSPSGPPFHFANFKLPEMRPNLM